MREVKETLWDLFLCIGALSILIAVAGAIVVDNKVSFALGAVYGGLVAAILAAHMYQALERTLDYDEEGAKKHAQKMAGIRMWIMLAAVAVAMYFSRYFHLVGVVLGVLTLKMSAYMQPFVHRRITSKIYEKRRVKL